MPNKQRIVRVFSLLVAVAAVSAVLYGGFLLVSQGPEADAAVLELHGWAWSSNIGWISFNCVDVSACATTNYKVTFDDVSGNLSGYAWSSSIGWIDFAPSLGVPDPLGITGPPDGAGAARVVNTTTGEVAGWARACTVFASGCTGALKSNAERGDWNGWIKLAGTNHVSPNLAGSGGVTYNTALSKFIGFAWGGDVVGWLNFDQVTLTVPPPLPAADIKANGLDGPISIPSGSSATLTWCGSPASPCANAASCSVAPGGWTGTSRTQATGALVASQTYTLTCTNVSGSTSDAVTINVTSLCGNGVVDAGEECDNGAANGVCPATCSTSCTINSCIAASFDLSFDKPLTVNFSPALLSQSSTTTISALPQDGFTNDITLSVIDILDPGTGFSTTTLSGFYTPVFNPDDILTAAEYATGAQFRMLIHKSRANPNHEQNFLVVVRGAGGSAEDTIEIPLKLKASGSGSGDQ